MNSGGFPAFSRLNAFRISWVFEAPGRHWSCSFNTYLVGDWKNMIDNPMWSRWTAFLLKTPTRYVQWWKKVSIAGWNFRKPRKPRCASLTALGVSGSDRACDACERVGSHSTAETVFTREKTWNKLNEACARVTRNSTIDLNDECQ